MQIFHSLKKMFSQVVILTVIFVVGIFSLYASPARAANIDVSALVNTFISPNKTVSKTYNYVTAVLGINLAHSVARTLDAVKVTVSGSAPFDPAVDLSALHNTNDSSGLALYADGNVSTGDGTFTQSVGGDTYVALTSMPAWSAASRISSLTPAQTATMVVSGTSAIVPSGTYATPAVGDIVFYQSAATAGIWAIVTDATLTSGTFAVNGAALATGAYRISKMGGGAGNTVAFTTGAAGANPWGSITGAYTAPALGDVVMYQTGTSPAVWGVVTVATNTNQDVFKINGALLAATTAYKLTKITAYTPVTSAVDGAVAGKLTQGLNFAVGDLVIGNTGSGYVWGVVTTTENVAGAGTISALRINGESTARLFSASTQVSKITPSGTDLATAVTPTLTAGDVIFADPTLNAAPVTGYNFHTITTGGAGPAATALRLDGASAAPFWPYTVTLTPSATGCGGSACSIPANDTTAGNVGSDYYIVIRMNSSTAVDGHQFNVALRNNSDVTVSNSDAVNLAGLPTSANTMTVDAIVPTVNTATTSPANNSTGVPISAFIHMGFSENLDQSTINPTNVTFTAGGVPVPAGIRSFPNGFDVVVSAPPTFATSSRFATVASTSTAFYNMMGSSAISPQPSTGYASPTLGDIVITQRETFPPEVGIITDATLTSGTFSINGFPAFGGMQITKFGSTAATGLVSAGTVLTAGDIVVVNTTAKPADVRYSWHIVTTGAAVNSTNLRLDSQDAAPSYVASSRFSKISPSATAADNGVTNGGTLAVSVGDMVFIEIGSTYGWHLVTTAGNLSSDATENTASIDGGAGDPPIVANSQMSKLTPGVEGAVSAATSLSMGDIIMAYTTANASNGGAYAFHMVSGGAAINNTALRLDNFPGSLNPSTVYIVTATTGVKDPAGNPLATNNTLTFITGATGGTNTTPPFVQSSQPQPGSQTHPIGAPVRLTFSVDMASSGAGDITSATNIGLFTSVNGVPTTAITTTKTYDSVSKTVTLALVSPATLTASTDYVVKVNTTATSASTPGAPLTQPYFLFFKTASGTADVTPPTVLGVSPANSSTGVSLGAVIMAGFSEDMDPSTIISGRVKLALTSDITATVAGTVTYNPQSRSVSFAPSTALTANTSYTFTIVSGVSGVKDLSGNALASDYTAAFTTTATADTTKPFITFSNADNFSVAVTFSESMKTGGGPNAADNITNYTLETGAPGAVFATMGLGGKTITYDAGTKTAKITGLSLTNGNQYKITVAVNAQDLSGNAMDDTNVPPPKNVSFGVVQDSSMTGGQIGPGGGAINPSMQGMNPSRVMPMSRAAGANSNYHVEFLASTSIPATGQIVLTFPAGFTLAGATAVSTANSFCNADLNGPATGAPVIDTVVGNNDAGTVTITTTSAAATGANAFLCMDLSGIVNSTVPSSSGYVVTLQTKDTALNNRATLQNITTAPFFLGTAGSRTLTVNVFKDANSNGTNDAGEGINNATVFLFSPATGGQEATTSTNVIAGKATFSNLADGDYMIGIKPTAAINVAFNSAPQPFAVSATNLTKNFALSSATAITISGNIDGSGIANGTNVDVFASSPNGFAKTTVTLNGTSTNTYSLPVSPNSTYNVGVGPSIPESFFTPGSTPPPPPDFTFMPPPNVQVNVASASVNQTTVAGLAFILSAASKTITGTVRDSSATGISGAGIFCRPVASSTTGTASGFGTGAQTNTSGAFTVKVTEGVYLCGVFKPGMPPVSEKQITVGASANTPATLAFVLDANTSSLTISGTVTDDSGNAIPYAGVSGRKVVSTSDTTPIGGDSGNFVGGPTDANGAYTLYVSAGAWVIESFAPGFGRLGTKTVTVSTANLTGQDFSAQTLNTGTIKGQATKDSVAQQGVMVRAEGNNGGNMAVTDASGNYSLKVPAGAYSVSCFFPGVGEGAPIAGVVVTASTNTSGKNCALAAPITITVNLTNGTNPITGGFVDVRDSNGRGNGINVSTISGINAVYTINVPPGTYTVRAGHPSYGMIGVTSNISTTQSITYTASVGTTRAVTGTVTGDGTALANAWVSINGTPTGQTNVINLGGQTDANGVFSISVPAGSYRIRADKPGYKSPMGTAITVGGSTFAAGTIALTTASLAITGTVTLPGTGPVSNAFVNATDGNGGFAVAQTGADGAYSLPVSNGAWTVRAGSIGYASSAVSVTVSGSNSTGNTLTLTAISGFTVKPEKQETVTPTSGGFFTNTDIGANFKMNIPANALGTSSNASTIKTQTNTSLPNPPTGTILNKNAVTISATDSSGSPIKTLNESVTVTVPYTDTGLTAAQESSLVLGVWNATTNNYDTLPTTVDTTANTLTATVSHFSDFAPLLADGGAPGTPSGLAATVASASQIDLSWTATSGATSYDIYRSASLGGSYARLGSEPTVSSGSTVTYSDTGLSASTAYYYKISSLNGSGESLPSSAVTATTTAASSSSSGGGGRPAIPAVSPTSTTAPLAPATSETSAIPVTPATSSSNSGSQSTYNLGTTTLKNGSKGEAVKELQKVLNKILNMNLKIDGKLGPKTIAVIKKWQKAHGLKADGLIGAKTKAAMKAEAEKN